MSAPAGIAAQLGLAEESTWGTFAAPTRFMEFNSETLRLQKRYATSRGLRAGRRVQHRRKTVASWVEGGVDQELANVGVGVLFEHLLGAVATAGTGPEYTHTVTPGSVLGKGLTLQVGRPDDAGTVRAFSYIGMKPRSVEIAAREGEFASARWDFIGQAESTAQALGTFSAPTGLDPFASCDVTLEIASSGVAMREVAATIQRELTDPRARMRATSPTLGLEPLENGGLSVSGQCVLDFEDLTAYDRFVNDTDATLSIIATGATITSNPFKVQVDLNVAFEGETPQVSGPENLSQPLSFVAHHATSDASAVTVEIVTTDATP